MAGGFKGGLATVEGLPAFLVTVDGIETWVTGRLVTTMEDGSLTRLLENLAPIGRPLSEYLPDGALAAYRDLITNATDPALIGAAQHRVTQLEAALGR